MTDTKPTWRYEILPLPRATDLFGLFVVLGPEDIHWKLLVKMSSYSPPHSPQPIVAVDEVAKAHSLGAPQHTPAGNTQVRPQIAAAKTENRQRSLANLKKGTSPVLRPDGSYGHMTAEQTELFVQSSARKEPIVKQIEISGYPSGSLHHLRHALADRIDAARKALSERGLAEPERETERQAVVVSRDRVEADADKPEIYPPIKIPTTIYDVIAYLKLYGIDMGPAGPNDAKILTRANTMRRAAGEQPFVIEPSAISTSLQEAAE